MVVQHVVGAHGQPLYKLAVTSRSTVPSFTPSLRRTGVFAHSKTLQSFLLTKVINGERASYHAPRFLKLTVCELHCACTVCAGVCVGAVQLISYHLSN